MPVCDLVSLVSKKHVYEGYAKLYTTILQPPESRRIAIFGTVFDRYNHAYNRLTRNGLGNDDA